MKLWPVVTTIIGLVVGVVIGGQFVGGGAPSESETADEADPASGAPVR